MFDDASNLIVGLEIGTSKVCAVVGEINAEGALNIIGLGQARSRGLGPMKLRRMIVPAPTRREGAARGLEKYGDGCALDGKAAASLAPSSPRSEELLNPCGRRPFRRASGDTTMERCAG